jgi:hypothetical protein
MPDVTMTFSEEEQRVWPGILDAAVKQLGLPAVPAVAHFNAKLHTAQQAVAPVEAENEAQAEPYGCAPGTGGEPVAVAD